MKKAKISILLVLATLFSFMPVIADSGINIYVDGTELKSNTSAFIDNGSTMVPMRDIFERLNAEVEWNGDTKTITASKQDTTINLQIDSDTLMKNGISEQLDAVPVIVDDMTFVPVRAVSQALGANVTWDADTQTVYITSNEQASTDNTVTVNIESNVTMYAADGRTISVPQSEVEAYKGVGWYMEPVVIMYAPDGRTLDVVESEVEAYHNVGWYSEPVVTMYAPDGRTLDVIESEIEAYKGVGWYTEPVVLMYAADGRTTYAPKSEVEAYKGVGWYTEPYTPPKSSSSSGGSYSSSSGSSYTGTVYITPSGSRYHYSASCAGKNARATSLSSAKASGYTPCKKCAR